MPLYQYRCRECGREFEDACLVSERNDFLNTPCGEVYERGTSGFSFACHGTMKRVFSFALTPVMHEHFNHATGQKVSSMGEFKRQLSRANDEAEERTGVKHSFVPVDPRELAHTVTDEGMKSTHDLQVATGQKAPTPKLM